MRNFIGIELNQQYVGISNYRLCKEVDMFLNINSLKFNQ